MKKRILSMVLALAIVSALFVAPVSAAYSYSRDNASHDKLNEILTYGGSDSALSDRLCDLLGVSRVHQFLGWNLIDWVCRNCTESYGDFGAKSYDNISGIADHLNSSFRQWKGSALEYYIERVFASAEEVLSLNVARTDVWETFIYYGTRPEFSVAFDSDRNIHRISLAVYSVSSGSLVFSGFLTNSSGDFWYTEDDNAAYVEPTDSSSYSSGLVWVRANKADTAFKTAGGLLPTSVENFASYMNDSRAVKCEHDVLPSHVYAGSNELLSESNLCAIVNNHGEYLVHRSYYRGEVFDALIVTSTNDYKNWQTGTPQKPTETTQSSDSLAQMIQNNNEIILDAINKWIFSPEGDIQFIDNLTYDFSSKTYHFTSNTTNNYDITNNYYYYDNRSYTWNYSWTYHINYTSVTYIGQSEEYDKTYEFYYELPDGRSSADLTAEELEQLNLSIDVMNYGRSADDTRLRSLYHFDGTTDDASYWSYCTDFTWNKGASLTYMESGNFNGALYLDETEHDFTLTLPSGIGSGDFTLQFRYYQSHTEVPQDDSYIQFGDLALMRFNGSQILNGSSSALSAMPIGTWNEIAIIRDNGTMRFYLNGVQMGAHGNLAALGNNITFHFGSAQQTYKELDELRVLNYALVTGGANYTPTSVPHDTNLALVLPDGAIPVADEYYSFSASEFLSFDLSSSDLSFYTTSYDSNGIRYHSSHNSISDGPYFDTITTDGSEGFDSTAHLPNSGISILVHCAYCDTSASNLGYYHSFIGLPNYYRNGFSAGDYIISVVDSSDNVYQLSFSVVDYAFTDSTVNNPQRYLFTSAVTEDFDKVSISFTQSVVNIFTEVKSSAVHYREEWSDYIYILPQGPMDIVYIDIRPAGAEPFEFEHIQSVTLMDSASLNTPTLAVRSDIPVTNYQIGGVRPSIPYKGLVYAMVESGYITSLQIYDGRAWVACDGRIWTGQRWIPYGSYNVVTLSDMYDIADASGNSGYEYIYSESGFWSWFQKQWLAFREWCERVYILLVQLVDGNGSGSSDGDDESGDRGLLSKLGKLLGKLVGGLIDGIKAILGKLFDLLISLVELVGDRLDAIVEMVTGWFETLPESFGGVIALLSALFVLVPDELTVLLLLALAGLVFVGILKAIRR